MSNQIYLYHTPSGKSVITEFIDQLDPLTQARIRNAIRLLTTYGLDTSAGHSIKKLSNRPPVWELRLTGKQSVRLLFTSPQKYIFMIVHAFLKKTNKTPLKELRLAQKRAKAVNQL